MVVHAYLLIYGCWKTQPRHLNRPATSGEAEKLGASVSLLFWKCSSLTIAVYIHCGSGDALQILTTPTQENTIAMHALHQTLLPSSSIHHSLFLPHFTPSTIYPLPKPPAVLDTPDVKVIGNLVVAGAEVLRVFEIREESVPIIEKAKLEEDVAEGEKDVQMEEVGDGFFDDGHAEVGRMHLVLHGIYCSS